MALANVATELTIFPSTGWAAYVGKISDGSPNRFIALETIASYITTSLADITYILEVGISQLDTDIAAAPGVAKFPCPENMTIQSCFISVDVAPTGSSAIWDINVEGTSIMTNLITIEATEFSSLDAATQPSFSVTDVDKREDFVIDCDQTGATVAPQNAVLVIIYKKR